MKHWLSRIKTLLRTVTKKKIIIIIMILIIIKKKTLRSHRKHLTLYKVA